MINMINKLLKGILLFLLISYGQTLVAQSLSEKMAATVMKLWKDSMNVKPGKPENWTYEQGVMLEGITKVWQRTADRRYFDYVQKSMDRFLTRDGAIKTYNSTDYNIDNIKNGTLLLMLYKVTEQPKYLKAATLLWDQLKKQPRTKEGGFWHKNIYPSQMWLDGLYMGQPFYTEYAVLVNDEQAFDDIANQFIYMEKHARDVKTGLLYHGWDESKSQKWANQNTGTSPNFWARAMGWYGMALVDVLDNFPDNHPKKAVLISILTRFATAVKKAQDARSGLWYQILDKPSGKGNYHEASASSMFVYALAKGVRQGYLSPTYSAFVQKGFAAIKKQFITTDDAGLVSLNGTVSVGGLGGNPYRDGSYAYYMSEKVIKNDPKGVGAFILASNEMEIAAIPKTGQGKVITLDCFFNNEYRRALARGKQETFHYKWEELDLNGFSLFGQTFTNRGARITSLREAPTLQNLKGTDVYIIVDPDTEKETAKPNFMQPENVKAITEWVRAGGALVLFGNDTGNAELDHFNTLSESFGIHFNSDSKNRVTGADYEMGNFQIPTSNPIFKTAGKVYMKEVSSLKISAPAVANFTRDGDVFIATAKYGKGAVFVVGDPWLYNEYTDGRKLPDSFHNYTAANELAEWLLMQVPNK